MTFWNKFSEVTSKIWLYSSTRPFSFLVTCRSERLTGHSFNELQITHESRPQTLAASAAVLVPTLLTTPLGIIESAPLMKQSASDATENIVES